MFEVSIIIPSHNRYPLSLLSLNALKNQAFNLSNMEVILIDDASTDNTSQLKSYHPPYSFKYIRNQNNLGVCCARNIGLNLAQGKIIIFLDTEMIVGPDYVNRHYQHHMNNKQNVVVVGVNRNRIFTFLFPRFNNRQISAITRLFEDRHIVKERIKNRLAKKTISKTELQAFIRNLKKPIQLIDQHETVNLSLLHSFSEKISSPLAKYLLNYPGVSNLSWMACWGSNHSFPRSLVSQIGGYDKDFKLYGMEDLEFGYRLYKSGSKIIIDPKISRYHQEHSVTANRHEKGIRNTILFEKKHPVIDVCITSLLLINVNDFYFLDRVLQEHKLLFNKFPSLFNEFKRSIVLLLQQIPIVVLKKKKPLNLLVSSGIERDSVRKQSLFSDRNRIEALGEYNNLVGLFDILVRL